MTERRVLVKFEDKHHFKDPAVKALRALHGVVYPDGEAMSLGAAHHALTWGILMTRGQFNVLYVLFYSLLEPGNKGHSGGFYVCNPPSFLTL
jgi:hypothetical protein